MLKETDFKWLVRHMNNIPENPLDCEYCIVDCGDGTGKRYVVRPLHAQNTNGVIQLGQYKYFVFLDCRVRLAKAKERSYPDSMSLCAGYRKTDETLIAVFDTMEDAKKRAYTQYAHHFGYILRHIVDNIEEATRNHFVVGKFE